MRVIITSPSMYATQNVSGISAMTRFITQHNLHCSYTHFSLGKKDGQERNLWWALSLIGLYVRWLYTIICRPPSLIHFNVAFDKRGLLRDAPLILVARMFNRRVVTHLHGGELMTVKLPPVWLKRLSALAFGNGSVIVLGPAEKARIRQLFPYANVFVLPNCVSLERAATFRRGWDEAEPLRLLFLGRIEPNKGIDILHTALTQVKEQGIRFRLVVAGAGPSETEYVRSLTKLLGEDFEFAGVVDEERKAEILKRSDVFVLPSRFEGLPVALLESMAFGLVPVVSNVGSVETVVTHGLNGLVTVRENTSDIVAALSSLANDRKYVRRLSENARASVFERCRADRYVQALNKVYQHG